MPNKDPESYQDDEHLLPGKIKIYIHITTGTKFQSQSMFILMVNILIITIIYKTHIFAHS